ncbi:hypothetical protein G6F50_013088 [Rhizopus delemar]|uniref:Copper resistance protein B n=1 Tax=Rhizopus delemar TaxID=936053 RepID=A0A9P7CH89_9FUNG|nr:hypothetical protein G6F50_013088 [Rhizopus delemar]
MDHGAMDHSSMPRMDHGAMSPAPAPAAMDHAAMGHGAAPASDAPPIGSLPTSDGAGERGYDSYGIHPHMMDNASTWQVLFVKFGVTRNRDGENALDWDGRFWGGSATDRLLIKSEGERENGGGSDGKACCPTTSNWRPPPMWDRPAARRWR